MSASAPLPDPYLLREPGYWRWVLAGALLRLPAFMAPLGFVVLGVAMGSRAAGGLMVTAEVVLSSVGAPFLGRLVDRWGPRTALPRLAYASVPVLAAVALAAALRWPTPLLVAGAGLVGLLSAPRSAGLRTLLGETLPAASLRAALTLNATVSEIAVLASPMVVGAAALLAPVAVPAVMAAACLAGGRLIRALPARGARRAPVDASGRARGVATLLASRAAWLWIALYIGFGQVFGTVETGALSWARAVHAGTWGAAAALAILSAAGIASSFAYLRLGTRRSGRTEALSLSLLAVMVGGLAALSLSRDWLEGAVSMAAIGAAAVPLIGVASHAAAEAMPPGRQAEGLGLLAAAQSGAYALAGILLAVLPLHAMLLAGTATGLIALALTPLWLGAGAARPGNPA